MHRILLATHNPDKAREIKEILSDSTLEILTLEDFPGLGHPKEDGRTYEENSRKKAIWIANNSLQISIADDSGLEIDSLDGIPGIFSARFGGEKISYFERNKKILQMMDEIPEEKRKARFICVATIASPGGEVKSFTGICEGAIATEMRGEFGFGYDPIFLLPELGKTMAEIPSEKKNKISHRAKAFQQIKDYLQKNEKIWETK